MNMKKLSRKRSISHNIVCRLLLFLLSEKNNFAACICHINIMPIYVDMRRARFVDVTCSIKAR